MLYNNIKKGDIMQNIKDYSEREVYLIIVNDEYLYSQRLEFKNNPSSIDIFFNYTEDQLNYFLDNIE